MHLFIMVNICQIIINMRITKERGWHKKKLGGGVIDSQIHELDYCLYLLEDPKSIFALGGKKVILKLMLRIMLIQ